MVIGSFALVFAASVSFSAPAALMQQTRESVRGAEPDSLAVVRGQLQRVTLTQQSLVRDLKAVSAALRRAATETEKATFRARVDELSARLQRSLSDADILQAHLRQMCADMPAPEGWLGISINETMDVTATPSASTYAFKRYPVVVAVDPGSPAQKAGFASGDELLTISGRDMVSGAFDIGSLLKPGVQLPVRLRREGEIRTVTVFVEPRPEGFSSGCPWVEVSAAPMFYARPKLQMFELPNGGFGYVFVDSGGSKVVQRVPQRGTPVLPPTAHVPSRLKATIAGSNMELVAGAVLLPLTDDLRENLGLDDGVLVYDVLRGSPALEAGLRAGDIITRVNGQKLQSILALIAIMDQTRDREVELQVSSRRSSKPRTVLLPVR